MAWSNKADREIDIPPGATAMLDVVFSAQGSQELHLATINRPASYSGLLTLAGGYQFTLQIHCANGGAPTTAQVRAHWGGSVDTFGPMA
jgi:hypothetical protein